jgi:uncharacterized membrane protein
MTAAMGETLNWSSGAWLIGLGAFHGINPGMGWLFAVALGLQEHRRTAVWRALLPLACGHALAVTAAIGLALFFGAVIPIRILQWIVAAILLLFGAFRIVRHRHPRWASMRVSMAGLTLWSFLMASAHGGGLMVVPVFLRMTVMAAPEQHHMAAAGTPTMAFIATGLHTLSYLVVTALIAMLVFEKLGLGLLRKAWFNLDYLWAAALCSTGVLTAVA